MRQEDLKGKENEALAWMQEILGETFPEGVGFYRLLRDGIYLCKLINKLAPGSVKKINMSGPDFKMVDNVASFMAAIQKYGVPSGDLFQTVDLCEGKNLQLVLDTIYALGRTTYTHPEFPGPHLGPRPAEENKKEWTEEQLRMSEGFVGLQAGSNKGASQAGMNYGKPRGVIHQK